MKKKLGNPGKVGQVATKGKSGKVAGSLQQLDAKSIGSAMGILRKHHK